MTLTLTIDSEFRSQIPPLCPKELAALEANIAESGCRDALVVWRETGILLDGHNRFDICARLGVPYNVVDVSLPHREAAMDWIDRNQLARRNLSPDSFKLLLGRIYNREKQAHGGDRKSKGQIEPLISMAEQQGARTDLTVDQNDTKSTTAEKLSKQHGVSPATVKRAGQLADAAQEAVQAEPELVAKGEKEILKAARKIQKAKNELKQEKRRQCQAVIAAQTRERPNAPVVVLDNAFDWLYTQPECELLLTDPPYSTEFDGDFTEFSHSVVQACGAKVKPGGAMYICCGGYPDEVLAYLTAPTPIPLRQILVWTYNNTIGPSPSARYFKNYQLILFYAHEGHTMNDNDIMRKMASMTINAPDGRQGDRYHTWQKPDDLAERVILNSSNPGDLVLDPYCCTGTFPLAASRLGRIGRGCDISPENLQIAVDRGCRRA